jgi:DNA invertase Pin-like site-specific DNA recombinase
LARSVRQLLNGYARKARHSAADGSALETTTPQGRLVFHMFGALAVFERSLIRERTLAGLAVARREGLIGGRRTEMVPSDVAAAEAVLANPKLRVASIARRFVVPFPTSIAASRPHG